jgi:parallel beta-helix repeat protein
MEKQCMVEQRMWRTLRLGALLILAIVTIDFRGGAEASPTLCVNPTGNHGCFATVQAAINAVSAINTTIVVKPGNYEASCGGAACSVAAITSNATNASSLTGLKLQCAGSSGRPVVLDATSLDHAVYVSGVNRVTIAGCVAEGAGREGILVENADNAHIVNNNVKGNDQAMAVNLGSGTPPCPIFLPPGNGVLQCCPDAFSGGPGNFPQDNDDCGEGIHLRSVTGSVIQGNAVHDNKGGILL